MQEYELRQIDFLQGICNESLARLTAAAQVAEFPPKTTIFRQGEPATDTFFVISGMAVLEICAPGVGCQQIGTVSQGELLGWSPVLSHKQLFATARTIDELVAFQIPGSVIHKLCDEDPQFGYQFMLRTAQTLAARLSAARMQLLDIYSHQSGIPAGTDHGEG